MATSGSAIMLGDEYCDASSLDCDEDTMRREKLP